MLRQSRKNKQLPGDGETCCTNHQQTATTITNESRAGNAGSSVWKAADRWYNRRCTTQATKHTGKDHVGYTPAPPHGEMARSWLAIEKALIRMHPLRVPWFTRALHNEKRKRSSTHAHLPKLTTCIYGALTPSRAVTLSSSESRRITSLRKPYTPAKALPAVQVSQGLAIVLWASTVGVNICKRSQAQKDRCGEGTGADT